VLFNAGLLLAATASAAEFRAVATAPGVLYDAPSEKAKKLYVLSPGYPVEIIVTLEKWVKVRDAEGMLNWITLDALTSQRTLMVNVPLADIRQAADSAAPLLFQAEQNVVLQLVEFTGNGWARIKHRDGESGYVRLDQVWGA
jgi:SH3-like domain-containing protein